MQCAVRTTSRKSFADEVLTRARGRSPTVAVIKLGTVAKSRVLMGTGGECRSAKYSRTLRPGTSRSRKGHWTSLFKALVSHYEPPHLPLIHERSGPYVCPKEGLNLHNSKSVRCPGRVASWLDRVASYRTTRRNSKIGHRPVLTSWLTRSSGEADSR